MSTESVMLSDHVVFCCPLLLLPSVFLSISVFSSESALHIRWPKYWSFSFSISPSNEYSGLISFRVRLMAWSHCSPRNSQESSLASCCTSADSLAVSFLYGPVLTCICDYYSWNISSAIKRKNNINSITCMNLKEITLKETKVNLKRIYPTWLHVFSIHEVIWL